MPASPSTANYRIPAATLSIKLSGDADYVDAGNLVDFSYTPSVEKQEHFSARTGIRTKDFTTVTQTGASISFTVDEITARNLSLFLLGDISTDTDGNEVIEPLSNPNLTADIKVTATNTAGPMLDFTGNVTFSPSGDLSLMADDTNYAQIPLTADVNKANDKFGTFTLRQQA